MGSTRASKQELPWARQGKSWVSSLITCRRSGPNPGLQEAHLELLESSAAGVQCLVCCLGDAGCFSRQRPGRVRWKGPACLRWNMGMPVFKEQTGSYSPETCVWLDLHQSLFMLLGTSAPARGASHPLPSPQHPHPLACLGGSAALVKAPRWKQAFFFPVESPCRLMNSCRGTAPVLGFLVERGELVGAKGQEMEVGVLCSAVGSIADFSRDGRQFAYILY